MLLYWAFIHLDSSAIVIHSASTSPFIVATVSRIHIGSRARMRVVVQTAGSTITIINEDTKDTKACQQPSVAQLEEGERTLSENPIGQGTTLSLNIVRDFRGPGNLINVLRSDKIYEVKVKIQAQTGIPPCQQDLILAGASLDDDRKLDEYDVRCGSTLFLVTKRGSSSHEAREEVARPEM